MVFCLSNEEPNTADPGICSTSTILMQQFSLSQVQLHLVVELESQAFVEMASVFAGMQGHACEALLLAPGDHGVHDFAGDAPAAVLGIGVDDHDSASGHDFPVIAGEP